MPPPKKKKLKVKNHFLRENIYAKSYFFTFIFLGAFCHENIFTSFNQHKSLKVH